MGRGHIGDALVVVSYWEKPSLSQPPSDGFLLLVIDPAPLAPVLKGPLLSDPTIPNRHDCHDQQHGKDGAAYDAIHCRGG